MRGALVRAALVVAVLQGHASSAQEVSSPAAREIVLESFDLGSPNARWQFQPGARFVFEAAEAGAPAHWRFERDGTGQLGRGLWSRETFPVLPNRRYRMALHMRTDFRRADSELNAVLLLRDAEGNMLPGRRFIGLPARTEGPGGWETVELEWVTPPAENLVSGAVSFWFNLGEGSETPFDFRIARAQVLELPADVATDRSPVEQVTFRGGPGRLPLVVGPAERLDDGRLAVKTTGLRWMIDPKSGTIECHQRIGRKRKLCDFRLGGLLDGLTEVDAGPHVTVLRGPRVALGFQCDGMLAIDPLVPAEVAATAAIEAPFVRLGDGHLLASDGRGGFTVNPYPEPGSGQMPRCRAVTEDLDFTRFERLDLQSLSSAPAGWSVAWTLEPRERLFVSGFPPREYPWEQSFRGTWMLSQLEWEPEETYGREYWRHVAAWILWNPHLREWGMSFGDDYIPRDPGRIRAHVAAIKEAGCAALFYSSAWFFASRDPDLWVDAVMEEVETFGFDGVYSDGLPAVEWLVGYEELRMLRERIDRDGPGLVYVHDSVPQSGRHPAAWMPWLYTWADVTYMAEHVPSDAGIDWSWVRYVISGFRTTGGIGAVKGDRWDGPGFGADIDRFLAGLVWNARIGGAGFRGHNDRYVPMRDALEALWREHGDEPDFYEGRFLPKARELFEGRER